MFYLQHNHDTSINTLAEQFSIRVKAIIDNYATKELSALDTNNVVSLVSESLKSDLEKLISKLDNDGSTAGSFLPKILITKSNQVNATSYGALPLKFAQKEFLTLENIADSTDTIELVGNWFDYEVPIQILILTRSGYANKELSLEVLRILYDIKHINYKLKVFDDVDPSAVHTVENFGEVSIFGFENKSFESTIAGADNSIVINTLEFSMRENYFKLDSGSGKLLTYDITEEVL